MSDNDIIVHSTHNVKYYNTGLLIQVYSSVAAYRLSSCSIVDLHTVEYFWSSSWRDSEGWWSCPGNVEVLSTELYTTDFKFLTIPRVPTEEKQCAGKLKIQRLLVHKYCRSCAEKQPKYIKMAYLEFVVL